MWFLNELEAARVQYPFDLWAFVIMPQHVHLLVSPHDGVTVSSILKRIKQPVTLACLEWVRRNSPQFLASMRDEQPCGSVAYRFWQRGGGYDRNLWSAEEIHEKMAYIHNNPVRKKLVERAEEWPWSSARAWKTGLHEPIRIDFETVPMLIQTRF